MQCKSGCAQAGQNKKRRADARLSWDGVEKLAIGLLLNQNGIDDISAGLFTIFVQCKTDISALDFNILCTGDIREQLSTIQLLSEQPSCTYRGRRSTDRSGREQR